MMNATIDLPTEVYERLQKQAQLRGATVSETVAQLLEEEQAARAKAFWERLEADGLVAKRKSELPADTESFQPIQVQGKPLSEIIIEDRR